LLNGSIWPSLLVRPVLAAVIEQTKTVISGYYVSAIRVDMTPVEARQHDSATRYKPRKEDVVAMKKRRIAAPLLGGNGRCRTTVNDRLGVGR
jgi:hypothetical protein